MQYDLSTTGGNSGSPVFNENEVIGIHWGGVPNEFNGAVFINENVRNFLKQNIEDIHFANDDQPNNPDTLITLTILITLTSITLTTQMNQITLTTLTTLIINGHNNNSDNPDAA